MGYAESRSSFFSIRFLFRTTARNLARINKILDTRGGTRKDSTSGNAFFALETGIQFYRDYGALSGFDIRRSTTKRFSNEVIRQHYVLCNREGFKNTKNTIPAEPADESESSTAHGSRKRTSNRVGCNARCIFEYTGNGAYKIRSFEERHTHPMAVDTFKQFLKVNRNLNFGHQQFIINCTKANIGSSKQHELFKEMVADIHKSRH
ncbi:hypothetical protein DH2020_047717 [Rehmannia glutinosa]|uniref:FAR1 domain-containing protein n=1 Tax=Rehmannia glutinosa TaxID=99300 RepID=A0ABR0U7P0_REHGL